MVQQCVSPRQRFELHRQRRPAGSPRPIAYNYTAAVANPQSRLDISPRFDFQLSPNNTLTVRYMFDRQKQSNSGVSQFALETQGYDVSNFENTLQVSDTQILSAKTINETRFQYIRDARQPGWRAALIRPSPCRAHSPAAEAMPESFATTRTASNLRTTPPAPRERTPSNSADAAAHHARRQLLQFRIQRKLHLQFAYRSYFVVGSRSLLRIAKAGRIRHHRRQSRTPR